MSPAMLSVLVKMMLAQAQESTFEKVCLPGSRTSSSSLVKVAQEAAKVSLAVSPDFWGEQAALVWAPWRRQGLPTAACL